MFMVTRLAMAHFTSIQLCLYWPDYHETVAVVNVAKWDKIVIDVFYFSQHCHLGCTCAPASVSELFCCELLCEQLQQLL